MISDGHIVGNHSYHHPDMSQISSIDSFSKELQELSDLYKEATGQEMKNIIALLKANTAKPT